MPNRRSPAVCRASCSPVVQRCREPRTGGVRMSKLRVHNFSISLDGYGAGPNQTREEPLGRGGEDVHNWMFATEMWHRMTGQEGGETGLDDQFAKRGNEGFGATIMGRNMFGPIRGQWT